MLKIAEKICKHKKIILAIALLLLIPSVIGMKATRINYDILAYLPDNVDTVQGENILTNEFNMGSYSIVITENMSTKDIQKLDIYQKGYIYIQSLPSMVPPLVLAPKENENILDLTAAPGSKTTQIVSLMNGKGHVLANELDKMRCEKLKYNVKMQGADIVEVVNGRGEKIGSQYKEQFDRVLLDTPCSGEGRFTAYDVQSYRVWSPKKVNELTKMQKKLFQSAYDALKPNGILVYSTCTLNKEENEYILDWALKNFNLKMVDIDVNIKNAMPGINDGLEKDIKKSIRILPSKDMEGFFVSKFIKK